MARTMWINGASVGGASDDVIEVLNPYTEQVLDIAMANDSVYGLGANLYTNNARYVKRFYEEVRAGTLWINDPLTDNDAGPFGGFGMSGIGRELGEEGLDEFRETKHVHWDFGMEPKVWW